MSKEELMTAVAAILTTLLETDGSPESMLYLALSGDMRKWEYVRNVLLRMNAITIKANYVTLTEEGRSLANDINAALAKGRA